MKDQVYKLIKDPGGSMSQVVGLPNNSYKPIMVEDFISWKNFCPIPICYIQQIKICLNYKPITNTAWVSARFCKLQKGCTPFAAAGDNVDQLLAHGRWYSPGTPAYSTTKTCHHDIAAILLKVALNTKNQVKYKSINIYKIILIL